MTVTIEATQTDLPALLEQIELGDGVRLMKKGRTVARIFPQQNELTVLTPEQRARAQQALRDRDALSRKLKLGPFNFEEFKADRDEGRR